MDGRDWHHRAPRLREVGGRGTARSQANFLEIARDTGMRGRLLAAILLCAVKPSFGWPHLYAQEPGEPPQTQLEPQPEHCPPLQRLFLRSTSRH